MQRSGGHGESWSRTRSGWLAALGSATRPDRARWFASLPLGSRTLHQRPKRCQGERGKAVRSEPVDLTRGRPLLWRRPNRARDRLESAEITSAAAPRLQARRGRPPSPPRAGTDKGRPCRCAGRTNRRDCRAGNRLRVRDARGTMVRAKVSFVSWRSSSVERPPSGGLGTPQPLPMRQGCMRHAMEWGD